MSPANSANTTPVVLTCAHCHAPIRAAADVHAPTYLHVQTGRSCCVDGELGTAEPAATITHPLGSIA
jgi:hypothetical protein